MLTPEQRKQRIGYITSSRTPAILGLSPYQAPEDVMRVMVREHWGAPDEFAGNAATEHGNKYEAEAIAAFEIETGYTVEKAPFKRSDSTKYLADNSDGWVSEGGAMLEVKCPYSGKIESLYDRPDYLAQCHHHSWVWRAKGCWFACYAPGKPLHYEFLAADNVWWDEGRLDTLKQFHDRYLEIVASEELSAPYLEAPEVDLSGDDFWCRLEERYEIAQLESTSALAKLALIDEEIKTYAASRGKPCYGNRYRVAPVAGRKTIKYKGALKDAGITDLDEYTTVGKPTWRITSVAKDG